MSPAGYIPGRRDDAAEDHDRHAEHYGEKKRVRTTQKHPRAELQGEITYDVSQVCRVFSVSLLTMSLTDAAHLSWSRPGSVL